MLQTGKLFIFKALWHQNVCKLDESDMSSFWRGTKTVQSQLEQKFFSRHQKFTSTEDNPIQMHKTVPTEKNIKYEQEKFIFNLHSRRHK